MKDCHRLGSEPFPDLGASLEARGTSAPESHSWPEDAWQVDLDGELHQRRGERVLEKQAALFDPERYEQRPCDPGQFGGRQQ